MQTQQQQPPRSVAGQPAIRDASVQTACRDARAIVDSVHELTQLLEDDNLLDSTQIVASSASMRSIVEQAKRFSQSAAAVLLTGESGTGKEVIARLIHSSSPRAEGPYVRVNCAALSESLIESELFGHERGAFTGAVDARPGRFECADGGTILLDEITEIPIHLQAKLLRVLEEEEYQRVGGNKTYRVDVRVIATTNRCLRAAISAGTFRADLYYRLNVLQLKLPPLRQRKEDINALICHFIEQFRHEASSRITGVDKETLKTMRLYDWPGNVRQLRNVIHRACVLNGSGILQTSDVPFVEQSEASVPNAFENMKLEEIERHIIVSNLRRFNGNKTATARHLGVTSRTLANKMKRYRELGYV